jgi:SPP1 family holin
MKISKGTIVRTIMVALVIINIILERNGIDVINIGEHEIAMAVETAIEIGVIVAGWWYNNSFTPKARKAQKYLQDLRDSEEE